MTALSGDVGLWHSVAGDERLLRAAGEVDAADVAAVVRLRRGHAAERVAVALQLVAARRAAAVKFPGESERMVADVAGVEQATSLAVARHKARRWRDAGVKRVVDLGCGIGGDTMGFVRGGLATAAVDRDPVRAWMAGWNAGCPGVVAEAGPAFDEAVAVHLDPARRSDTRRLYRLADHDPPPAVVRGVLRRHRDVAVKLSPAVDLEELEREYGGVAGAAGGDPSAGSVTAQPADLHPRLRGEVDVEVEFISEAGRLVQAVRWQGRAARAARSATLIRGDEVHELVGEPGESGEPGVAPPGRYLFTVDAAVERAGLMHRLGLPIVHPRLGLLTADRVVESPWLTGFELLHRLPYRPKRVKAWLREHDAGLVEVKTRGKAVDPDAVQRELRGAGPTPLTVFVLRFDRQLVALVTRRVA